MGSEEGIGGLYDKICKVENLLSAWTNIIDSVVKWL